MEVILLESIKGLGDRGNRVSVARGYARNYLFPRRLAVQATKSGESIFRQEVEIRSRREAQQRLDAEQVKATLAGVAVRIRAQASEEGRLYGSVTQSEIAGALAEIGREIDRKAILLEEHIKELGEYTVDIRLGPGVVAQIQVAVERPE